jgi:hypothetical protein
VTFLAAFAFPFTFTGAEETDESGFEIEDTGRERAEKRIRWLETPRLKVTGSI